MHKVSEVSYHDDHVHLSGTGLCGAGMLILCLHECSHQRPFTIDAHGKLFASSCPASKQLFKQVHGHSILCVAQVHRTHVCVLPPPLSRTCKSLRYECRSVLLVLLAHVLGNTWIIEQPSSSLFYLHTRFQWLLRVCLPWEIPASGLTSSISRTPYRSTEKAPGT